MVIDVDNLLFERVIIIKYQAPSSTGFMIMKASFYEKKINKFKKAFKDCNIYYMSECILTPENVKELGI